MTTAIPHTRTNTQLKLSKLMMLLSNDLLTSGFRDGSAARFFIFLFQIFRA